MEIERKYLIPEIPNNLHITKTRKLEQGYLCTSPVVRIRKDNDQYELTYKSSGLMVRQEYNLPLTKEAYEHLRKKADGRLIVKTRYEIPLDDRHKKELDFFHGYRAQLILEEVEFADEDEANQFTPPEWFGEDVTFSSRYHNSNLSRL